MSENMEFKYLENEMRYSYKKKSYYMNYYGSCMSTSFFFEITDVAATK
jgi:hypothetical protein